MISTIKGWFQYKPFKNTIIVGSKIVLNTISKRLKNYSGSCSKQLPLHQII